MRQDERLAILRWEELKQNMRRDTPVDYSESVTYKRKRIKELESDPEKWFKYYFPKYAYAEPAKFHKRATKRILKNNNWYEVRAWSRELAKDTRTMFEFLYMTLTGRMKTVLLVSFSEDNAERLLEPFKLNLEANQRIIHDYGIQEKPGKWEAGEFTTQSGVSFRAIGAGQSPRGTRNEYARPDGIIITDIDTDETVRNPAQVKKRWDWIEKALIPTVSVSGNWRIVFLNNIIAKDCCVTRAMEYADYVDIINIRDKNGVSTWIEKNSEEAIDRILSKLSYKAQQGEYYNNPITEGTVFKEIYYKKLPPLTVYKNLMAYGDPSFKESKKNDFKAIALVGQYKDEWHVVRCFCGQTSTAQMAAWYKIIHDMCKDKVPVYMYLEANATQDLVLNQINKHIFENNWGFAVSADMRSKGDKYSRIESLLEPINRVQKLWFNEKDKEETNTKEAERQMLALEPALSYYDDFPDALHGGISLYQEKTAASRPPIFRQIRKNSKRY